MADVILQYLMWAIPSGGIGAAIAWVANRKTRAAKAAKEVHDTYKAMYEDISTLLVETQKKYEDTTRKIESLDAEHVRTRRALNRLSRAIEAIQLCPHRGSCPVSDKLQDDEEDDGGKASRAKHGRAKGQRSGEHDRDVAGAREGADDSREPDAEPGLAAPAATGSGLHGPAGTGKCESEPEGSDNEGTGAVAD